MPIKWSTVYLLLRNKLRKGGKLTKSYKKQCDQRMDVSDALIEAAQTHSRVFWFGFFLSSVKEHVLFELLKEAMSARSLSEA